MSAVLTEQEYLSPQQIAERFSFTVDAVQSWIIRGVTIAGHTIRLHAIKVGKSWRVPAESWNTFLAACNPPGSVQAGSACQSPAAAAADKRLRKRLGLNKG
jgi:hypothetical protein